MSNVTTLVIITTSVMDEPFCDETAVARCQSWLVAKGFAPLAILTDHFSGNKAAGLMCAGGAYNYFPHEQFIPFAMAQEWFLPEQTIIVVYTESEPPQIFRPTA